MEEKEINESVTDEIVIGGQSFKRQEVESTGQKLAKRKTNQFRWTGAAFLSAGATFVIAGFVSDPIAAGTIVVGGILFILGLVFFLVSFAKRDPIKYGTKYYLRQMKIANQSAAPTALQAGNIGILSGRTIQISRNPLVRLTFNADENSIQIFSEKRYSKIYSKSEVIDYELRVDNEVVMTSNSKKGMGKSIAMGAIGHALFGTGGAGMMAGGMAASQKTTQSTKEVHHYTLLIKVRDLDKASYYMPIDTVEIAEEVITILDMIIGKDQPQVQEQENPAPVKEIPEANKTNKFEEIKKYKDLLDAGIITQEEFEQKKKELL